MSKQLVISIDREYGSGGREIGQKLAEKLGLEFVDKTILDKVAENAELSYEAVAKYDEKPKRIFSRSVRGYSNSPEQNIADLQFAYLKNKAVADESFVVLGRCSDTLFKEICPCISIFISCNKADKIRRIAERREVEEGSDSKKVSAQGSTNCSKTKSKVKDRAAEALRLINKYDKALASYHDYYCNTKWGAASSYDICVNSSILGIDGTVSYLYNFINEVNKI